MKSKKQVAMSQNDRFAKDTGSKPISTSHDADKLATKGGNKSLKKMLGLVLQLRGSRMLHFRVRRAGQIQEQWKELTKVYKVEL